MKNKQRKGIKSNNLIVKNYQNITATQPLFRFFLNKKQPSSFHGYKPAPHAYPFSSALFFCVRYNTNHLRHPHIASTA
jgi:hypothetical protein